MNRAGKTLGGAVALVLVLGFALLLGLGWQRDKLPPPVLHPVSPAQSSAGRIVLAPGRELIVPRADGGSETVTSLLDVPGRMDFGDFVWNDAGVPAGPAWVRVDLGAQTLSVFRAGQEIATTVILYGAENKPTPTGWLQVLEKAEAYYSRSYDAPMPFMLRLTDDGVALHASVVEPGKATHGCIGLPYPFARKLYAALQAGDRVLVVGPAKPRALTPG